MEPPDRQRTGPGVANARLAVGSACGLAITLAAAAAARVGAENRERLLDALPSSPATLAAVNNSSTVIGLPGDGRRCDRCHKVDSLFSHPADVVPSMQVPPGLPLYNGRVTCLTCHDDRAANRHGRNAKPGGDMMLRDGRSVAQLCAQCHDSSLDSRSAAHGSALRRAHLRWPDRRTVAQAERSPGYDFAASALDSESTTCLGCHDGTMAPDVDYESPLQGRGRSQMPGALRQSHPIGVKYAATGATRQRLSLRPALSLDDRIRLFDGRVGCGSCHSPYAGVPDLLAVTAQGSMLCLACHEDR